MKSAASDHFPPHHSLSLECADLPTHKLHCLDAHDHQRALLILLRPHFAHIDFRWYWNLYQLSIAYDFRPRLRSRLTLSGRAFLRKPWTFGGKDSHLSLATHANILSPVQSTITYDLASARTGCSSTNMYSYSQASVTDFSPVYLQRRVTRLVSCYALFK